VRCFQHSAAAAAAAAGIARCLQERELAAGNRAGNQISNRYPSPIPLLLLLLQQFAISN